GVHHGWAVALPASAAPASPRARGPWQCPDHERGRPLAHGAPVALGQTAAIVLAAGAGTRMASEGNKVSLEIDGRPMLDWSLRVLHEAAAVDRIILVAARSDLDLWRKAAARFPKLKA